MDLVCTDGASTDGRGRTSWRVFPSLRNGIKSEFARKRLATQQPFQREPGPAHHAETFHRLIGIPRTGRLKPATSRKQHRQVSLVKTQSEQSDSHAKWDRLQSVLSVCSRRASASEIRCNFSRAYAFPFPPPLFSSSSRSAVSAANGARAMALFGCMTMSHPAGIS